MGYVHDTHMSQFIPPSAIQKSAGTWTPTVASNLPSDVRTAADAAFTLVVPIPIPSNSSVLKGSKLESVDLFYRISTANADDFATVDLDKVALPSTGDAPTAAALTTIVIDSAHESAALRKAAGYHTLTVTLENPVYTDNDDAYALVCIVDAAATTVFTLYGARANFTLRL